MKRKSSFLRKFRQILKGNLVGGLRPRLTNPARIVVLGRQTRVRSMSVLNGKDQAWVDAVVLTKQGSRCQRAERGVYHAPPEGALSLLMEREQINTRIIDRSAPQRESEYS